MAKLKILYLITKSNWGGAQRYVYDLASSLPTQEFEVVVALGGSGILKERLETAGIKVHQLSSLNRDISIIRDITSFIEIYSLISKERPDILHVNSSKAGGIGVFIGRILRVPRIIFTLHGLASNEDRPWWQKNILLFFHWLTILLSHTTIAVSQKIKNEVVFLPFVRGKIIMIHNGILEQPLHRKDTARKFLTSKNKDLGKFKNELWIGTVAELHKTKGLSYALEALHILKKTIPNLRYIIVGEGEERQQLEDLIKKYQLQNHVFLLGFVENAAQYLSAFDILLLPSISEALSYIIIEAGYAHLPIIATSVGGIPEIIEDKKTGLLVSPKNAPQIAEALKELIKKEDAREQYGNNLYNTILENFSFKKMYTKTVDIYNNSTL